MPEVNIFLDFFHSISFENYLNFKGKNSFTCLSPVNVIHGAYTSDYLAILNVLEYVTNGSYTAPIKASIEVKTTPAWINSCSKLLVKKSGKSQIVPSDFETRAITSFELRKEKQRFNTHPNYNKGFRTTAECLAPFNKC
ncbi:MAG: hypothetical protein IJE77_02225, partial [Thermoguttaceae bacterium]|nr:hypothetical protein [Thermoguttaceae bacterium]